MSPYRFNVFTGTLDEVPDPDIGIGPQGEQGEPGIQGPPGEPGDTYRHVQGVPASVWLVEHNLGYFPGGIKVRDSGGDLHDGRIEYLDANTLTISFFVSGAPVSFSGEAFIS